MDKDSRKILQALGVVIPKGSTGPKGLMSPKGDRQEEPVLIRHTAEASFGTIAGQQTIAELQDLMNVYAGRMTNMTNAYASVSPAWSQKDSTGFVDFTNDWNALQSRYNAAQSAAHTAVVESIINPLPASAIPAQAEYDGLLKAFRQCAPPDGCPLTKGDWEDLFNRLTVATKLYNVPAPVDNPPQPTATDVDQQAIANTSGIVPVAKGILGVLPSGQSGGIMSQLQLVLMGVLAGGGAVAGFMMGGPLGAAIGGVLGFGAAEVLKSKTG